MAQGAEQLLRLLHKIEQQGHTLYVEPLGLNIVDVIVDVIRFCHLFIIFLLKMAVNCRFLCTFTLAIRKECKDILLNRLSIHHHEKGANTYYWDCPNKAQISPYICVACGEPRVVWRKSAPLVLIKLKGQQDKTDKKAREKIISSFMGNCATCYVCPSTEI